MHSPVSLSLPLFLLALAGSVLITGCATGVRYDAKRLREEALVYNQDQIMDNLVRAKNGQLMLHVDIVNLNSTVEATAGLQVNGGQVLTRGLTAGAAGAVQRPFTFGINPFQRKDQVTFNTAPIIDDMDAYAPYIAFLQLEDAAHPLTLAYQDPANNPEVTAIPEEYGTPEAPTSLMRSEKAPAEGTYIVGAVKRSGGYYYYVPSIYRQQYFQLCLALMNHGAYKGTESFKPQAGAPAAKKPATKVYGQPKKDAELKALERNLQMLNDIRSSIR